MAAKDRPQTVTAAKLLKNMFPDSKIEENLMAGLCPLCGVKADESAFKDEASKHEFEMTGICNPCQSKVFD